MWGGGGRGFDVGLDRGSSFPIQTQPKHLLQQQHPLTDSCLFSPVRTLLLTERVTREMRPGKLMT